MIISDFQSRMLARGIPAERILPAEPMSRHTTFRVGGPAELFIKLSSAEELLLVRNEAESAGIPCLIIGNGSNLLVRDGGIRGVVAQIGDCMREYDISGNTLTAEAGCFMSALAQACLANSLSGMEALSGIPGTLGGAVTMNAGAYGSEIAQIIESATIVVDGVIREIPAAELELGYRTSAIQKHDWIVVGARLRLCKGTPDEIRARMDDFTNRRRTKQPLSYPSAGSTFKRPEGYFAGALIQQADMKGVSVGGAQVSELHAGFIINKGGATAADILGLIALVQRRVFESAGVRLETEVKIVGEDV